jgi:hypothetical protein
MKITHWLRVIHRDVGFLVVGISLIYGISGICLNHMNGKDPAFHTEEGSLQFSPGLTPTELEAVWHSQNNLPPLKRILRIDETHSRLMLDGGVGVYNSANGHLDYEKHTQRTFIYWIDRLHYNKVKHWSPVADCFAASLIFLALSGLFIVKGKHGLAGSGKWYLIAGLLAPVIYVIAQLL